MGFLGFFGRQGDFGEAGHVGIEIRTSPWREGYTLHMPKSAGWGYGP